MQEMGLEPTRYCYHRHLKPARLPIPPLLRTNDILSNFIRSVNREMWKIWNCLECSKNSLKIIKIKVDKREGVWYDNQVAKTCGSVGTGRRARLRILWLLQSCGFKSHLPHYVFKKKPWIFKAFFFKVINHCICINRSQCVLLWPILVPS